MTWCSGRDLVEASAIGQKTWWLYVVGVVGVLTFCYGARQWYTAEM